MHKKQLRENQVGNYVRLSPPPLVKGTQAAMEPNNWLLIEADSDLVLRHATIGCELVLPLRDYYVGFRGPDWLEVKAQVTVDENGKVDYTLLPDHRAVGSRTPMSARVAVQATGVVMNPARHEELADKASMLSKEIEKHVMDRLDEELRTPRELDWLPVHQRGVPSPFNQAVVASYREPFQERVLKLLGECDAMGVFVDETIRRANTDPHDNGSLFTVVNGLRDLAIRLAGTAGGTL